MSIRAGSTPTAPDSYWDWSYSADWPPALVIDDVQPGVESNISALGENRYVQYRIWMEGDGTETPKLHQFRIDYLPESD